MTLELPPGWTATPAEQPVDVRAVGRIADGALPGEAGAEHARRASSTSRAIATANGQTFDRGFQVIEYPHIRRYHIYDDGATRR